MKKDYKNIILGYKNYDKEQKYSNDFSSLDEVVEWLDEMFANNDIGVTRDFFDFFDQKYNKKDLIKRIKEIKPNFPYSNISIEESIDFLFNNRDKQLSSAEIKEEENL